MEKQLSGKKVIVAGGSRGIGKEIVLELAKQGAHILFTYVANEAEAKTTEAEGTGKWGHSLIININSL